jgi:hypothetical protein
MSWTSLNPDTSHIQMSVFLLHHHAWSGIHSYPVHPIVKKPIPKRCGLYMKTDDEYNIESLCNPKICNINTKITFHLYTKPLLNLYFTTNFMPSETGYLFQVVGMNNSLSFHQNNSSLNPFTTTCNRNTTNTR